MSQTSINLSTSPTPAQIISRSQTSNTTSSSITQQTMLLGSTSPTLSASQAQMYLRAQMVQNLTLRSQKLGVLSSSQNGPPKSSSQSQSLSLCPNKPVTSSKGSQPDPSESNRKGESPTPECRSTPVTRTSSIHHLIAPEHGGLPSVTSSVSASVIKSPSDPSHASIPPPPLLLPAATTRSNSTSMPNSIPSLENKPPQAIVKPQILTHVIEGFVIQEGLEPFPVSVRVTVKFLLLVFETNYF
ncbi:polyhomeotichypothetical protein [Limosa lapponica baueri]|uniref:Polyhomeotic-like protein 3 n=1 Tax=Limosa lapponica baueri TaxID=1758121 RepID=A0A2I0T8F0_LIMLA|nr:polyhomeotichypothetical protein [Limosa lapponica baueri]